MNDQIGLRNWPFILLLFLSVARLILFVLHISMMIFGLYVIGLLHQKVRPLYSLFALESSLLVLPTLRRMESGSPHLPALRTPVKAGVRAGAGSSVRGIGLLIGLSGA